MESSGALDSACYDGLPGPTGWSKKLVLKKVGTTKKKDVVYVAPDGEEIKTRRQLEKYLKNHPGGPSVADFDWGTGEMPRRSARLSGKGNLRSDSVDEDPAIKRSKADSDSEVCIVVSPRKYSKRKSGPAGKDVVMEDADNAEDGANSAADGLDLDPLHVKTGGEIVEHSADQKVGVAIGEPLQDDVSLNEALTFVMDSVNKVNAEEQALEVEDTVVITENIIEQTTFVRVTSELAIKDVAKLSEGETSLDAGLEVIQVENVTILGVPITVKADGQGHDLKSKEHIESHDMHALIDEPESKSPKQHTEPSLHAAELVGVST